MIVTAPNGSYSIAGVCVKLKFMSHNVVQSRGHYYNISGLTFRFASLKPPMPASANTQALTVI